MPTDSLCSVRPLVSVLLALAVGCGGEARREDQMPEGCEVTRSCEDAGPPACEGGGCACASGADCSAGHCCAAETCVPEPNLACTTVIACEDPPPVAPAPTCPSFAVTQPGDFAAIAGLECVGNLTIEGPAIASIPALPARIEGNLLLAGTAVERTDLPGVREIGGGLDLRDNSLLAGFAPSTLAAVGRGFSIVNNAVLAEARFPGLACLAGGGPIYENPLLALLDFPILGHLQTIEVRNNAALAEVNLPQLRSIGMTQADPARLIWTPREVTFFALPQLGAMVLPNLRVGNARFTLEQTGASTLAMPLLARIEGLYVGENLALTSWSFPALGQLGTNPGWCPLAGGGLGDECSNVYYVVENVGTVAASAAASFESFCAASGVPAATELLVRDAAQIYSCSTASCQCAP